MNVNSSINIQNHNWSGVKGHAERIFESKNGYDSNLGINPRLSHLLRTSDGRVVNRPNGTKFVPNRRNLAHIKNVKENAIRSHVRGWISKHNMKKSVRTHPKRRITDPMSLYKPSEERTVVTSFGDAETSYRFIKLIQKHYKRGYKDAYERYASAVSYGLAKNEREFNQHYNHLRKFHFATNPDETTGVTKPSDRPDGIHSHSDLVGFTQMPSGKPSFNVSRAICSEYGLTYNKANTSKAMKKLHISEGRRTVATVQQVLESRFSKVPEFKTLKFTPKKAKETGIDQKVYEKSVAKAQAKAKKQAEANRNARRRLQREARRLDKIKANRKRNRKRAKATSEKRRRYESKVASLSSDTASLKAVNHSLSFSNYYQSLQGSIASDNISTNASSAKASIINEAQGSIDSAKRSYYAEAQSSAGSYTTSFANHATSSARSLAITHEKSDYGFYKSLTTTYKGLYRTQYSTSAEASARSTVSSASHSLSAEYSNKSLALQTRSANINSRASNEASSVNSANYSLTARSGELNIQLATKQSKLHTISRRLIKRNSTLDKMNHNISEARKHYNAWHVKADREQHRYMNARNNALKFQEQVNRLKATADGLKERIGRAVRHGIERYSVKARAIASRAVRHVADMRTLKETLHATMKAPNSLATLNESLKATTPSVSSASSSSSSVQQSSVASSEARSSVISSEASSEFSLTQRFTPRPAPTRPKPQPKPKPIPKKHKLDLSRSRYWNDYLHDKEALRLNPNEKRDPKNPYDPRNLEGLETIAESKRIAHNTYTYLPDIDKAVNKAVGADEDYLTTMARAMAYRSHHPNPSDEHIPD